MRRSLITHVALCFLLPPATAFADRAAGDACAAGLSPPSQQIYSATVSVRPTPEAARGVVVDQTKKMIRAGALSPLKARSAAEAAGRCLALITK
jgi:hypothetical protein